MASGATSQQLSAPLGTEPSTDLLVATLLSLLVPGSGLSALAPLLQIGLLLFRDGLVAKVGQQAADRITEAVNKLTSSAPAVTAPLANAVAQVAVEQKRVTTDEVAAGSPSKAARRRHRHRLRSNIESVVTPVKPQHQPHQSPPANTSSQSDSKHTDSQDQKTEDQKVAEADVQQKVKNPKQARSDMLHKIIRSAWLKVHGAATGDQDAVHRFLANRWYEEFESSLSILPQGGTITHGEALSLLMRIIRHYYPSPSSDVKKLTSKSIRDATTRLQIDIPTAWSRIIPL